MIEVELKFRTSDAARVRTHVEQLGGRRDDRVEQADTYFAHPARDFKQTDEALRIRVVGDRACVTYKGPLRDQTTKSRDETEIWFEAGSDDAPRFAHVLERLGFRPVRTVRKQREPWSLDWQKHEIEIAFDDVEGLGEFVELDTSAGESEFAEAKQVLLSLAKELQLEDSERRSYLSMLMSDS
jgi:adenylate cyclase class 2